MQHLMQDHEIAWSCARSAARKCRPGAAAHCASLFPRAGRARPPSIAEERSTPMARSACGAKSSSIRPVPAPRSSRQRIGLSPTRARGSPLRRAPRAHAASGWRPIRRRARRNSGRRFRLAPGAPRRAASDRPSIRASLRSSQETMLRASSPAALVGASRKKAQAPSRRRSTRPASTSKFEMARNARLRLAEDRHDLAHRQLGFGEQGEEAQARFLPGRVQRGERGIEARVSGASIGSPNKI